MSTLRQAAAAVQGDILARRIAARFTETGGFDVLASSIADRFFTERYAKLVISMSMSQAKVILGFPPNASPSPDEIAKAYKDLAFKSHPDRGGDTEALKMINVAKDVLDNKKNLPLEKGPQPQRQPRQAPEVEETVKGRSFAEAMSSSGVPAGVEWKFVSIPVWDWPVPGQSGFSVFTLYGQTEQKHVFLALKRRAASTRVRIEGKLTDVEEDWEASEIDVPISQNIAKIAPKYMKSIGTGWVDIKPKPPLKYIAWTGGKPTRELLQHVPRSGGATLKDILLGTGLLSDEDPEVAGRKSVVEVFVKSSDERFSKGKKLKAEGKIKYLTREWQYDFFVRVNGKTEKLDDDTIVKMERVFIPWVLTWDFSEGPAKNLTRMRGGRFKTGPAEAIQELANCLTGEPSWLHIALEKAVEEWEEPTKTAALLELRENYSLLQAAEITGMTPFKLFRALHGIS